MNKLVVICMVFLYSVVAGVSTAGSLIDNDDGTVTDSGTHLMWQQGENSPMTWDAALTYCEGLSLAGSSYWRLPNQKELLTIVDETTCYPSINTTAFPNAVSSYYWSSTSYPWAPIVWTVNFFTGVSYNVNNTDTHYVRCVRGGL